jgi:hypothetical protein
MINRFDIVRILSIDNVKWVSGPPDRITSPHGDWSVVLVSDVKGHALISKDSTVVVIPVSDIALVASFDNNKSIQTISDIKISDLDQFDKETN